MNKELTREKFGEILEKYLKDNNIKQCEWAAMLGIRRDTLYKYRRGQRRVPGPILVACRLLSNGELNFNLKETK